MRYEEHLAEAFDAIDRLVDDIQKARKLIEPLQYNAQQNCATESLADFVYIRCVLAETKIELEQLKKLWMYLK
jgi:hypothetical protein